jgi:hypothetical protein
MGVDRTALFATIDAVKGGRELANLPVPGHQPVG